MLSAVVVHLLQSTLFALGVGILSLMLRRNRASIRFWLWLSASVKFLVPFALLSALGSHFPRQMPNPDSVAAGTERFSVVVDRIVAATSGMTNVTSAPLAAATPGHLLLSLLEIAWVCGTIAISAYWLGQWRRIQRLRATSIPSRINFPVPVRTSASMLEPAVTGILHPILLVPAGLDTWLSRDQLKAVLAHERCHVRRRDNLTASLHMVVEAVFWFHPLVWWLGIRLIAERERACDEEVLDAGNKPKDYAAGIVRICQNYLASPLHCVAGVGGGTLARRIDFILNRPKHLPLSALQAILLFGVAGAVVGQPIVSGHLAAAPVQGSTIDTSTFRNYVAVIPDSTPSSVGKDLVIAAANGNLAQVRSLLRKGADIEFMDGAYTPLTQAAQGGSDSVVQELLKNGAQIEHRRSGGDTPLILAASMGHLAVAKTLVDSGAQVNDQSDTGFTALMEASAGGHQKIVLLLLSRGADVNHESKDGHETALLLAARRGHDKVVRLLLDGGADFRHRRFDGETALDLAVQGRQVNVVETLLQRGASSKP